MLFSPFEFPCGWYLEHPTAPLRDLLFLVCSGQALVHRCLQQSSLLNLLHHHARRRCVSITPNHSGGLCSLHLTVELFHRLQRILTPRRHVLCRSGLLVPPLALDTKLVWTPSSNMTTSPTIPALLVPTSVAFPWHSLKVFHGPLCF